MTSETPWLSTQEEHLWRRWTQLNAELSATLQREMQTDAKLSLSDYEVLVHLTDSPEGRVRVSELALLLQWERSRVSHHLTRMEHRGGSVLGVLNISLTAVATSSRSSGHRS